MNSGKTRRSWRFKKFLFSEVIYLLKCGNQRRSFNEKFISPAAVFFFFSVCGYAQSLPEQPTAVSISVCELLKNKQKYIDRPVYVEGVLDIYGHKWQFKIEKDCEVAELFFTETDANFIPNGRFQSAVDHSGLTLYANKLTKQNLSGDRAAN